MACGADPGGLFAGYGLPKIQPLRDIGFPKLPGCCSIRFFGYFSLAREHDREFDAFLKDYEQLMAQGDVLHVGTHPPGLVMLHHGCVEICRASPGLSAVLRKTEPASLSAAFDIITQNHRGTPSALLPEHRGALWLAALITQLAAAATVIPLYLLIRRDFSSETAWLAAALWPAVPALALFLPKSDALYPLCGMLFFFLWLSGWEQRSVIRSVFAGLILFLGLSFSLALLPVLLCVASVTIWRGWLCLPEQRTPRAWSNLWFSGSCAAFGFVSPLVGLWWFKGVNLFSVWIWNYRNHARFYEEYARTYWKWLLVNPLEFCIAAGIPLAMAAVWGVGKIGITEPRSRRAGDGLVLFTRMGLAVAER